jgi:hypothetical protein
MLHLEFGGAVGSNFGVKMELSELTGNCRQLGWQHTLLEKTVFLTTKIYGKNFCKCLRVPLVQQKYVNKNEQKKKWILHQSH